MLTISGVTIYIYIPLQASLDLFIPGEVARRSLAFLKPVVMYASRHNPGAGEAARKVQAGVPELQITTLAPRVSTQAVFGLVACPDYTYIY